MVVDTDVHQGNGTAAIFANDASVFTLSIHQENNYPMPKPPSDEDIGLADGTRDAEYLDALEEGLHPFAQENDAGPDLLCWRSRPVPRRPTGRVGADVRRSAEARSPGVRTRAPPRAFPWRPRWREDTRAAWRTRFEFTSTRLSPPAMWPCSNRLLEISKSYSSKTSALNSNDSRRWIVAQGSGLWSGGSRRFCNCG